MNDNLSAVKTPWTTLDGAPSGFAEPHLAPTIPDHELLRPIGEGSYGEVWLARNVMGTYRAVKIVRRHTFKEDHPFEREFSGIQKFEPVSRSHEGLVDILQVGRNDQAGYFYYVMELADDESSGQQINADRYLPKTIGSEIAQRGRLSFDECLRLGMSLTAALGHLHKHGLIHRDIKPWNIIFVNGIPKLADIGLVTGVSDPKSYVGTEGFIPPEGPGGTQADIYSLGKVLYEIATGNGSQNFPELPTRLGELGEDDRLLELNEVIIKACETDLRTRYRSMEEMHSELALLLAGKSVKYLRRVERRLMIATRIGIALTALALMVAGAFYQAHRSSKEAGQRVVQLSVAYGVRLMDEGDWFGSLLWFSRALGMEDRPAQEEMHRYRFDSVLRQCPKLLQVCFLRGTVNFAAFSPDGRQVVTASSDHTAQVWDAVSGQPLTPPLMHEEEVSRVAFSPEGRRVVTASMDGTARIWDAVSGRPLTPPLRHSGPVRFAAFSDDGGLVVTASHDNTARVWNAVTGEPDSAAPLRHDNWVISANFSPDGRRVVTTSKDDTAQVWEVATSRPIGPRLKHEAEVRYAQFSPNGRWVVTASWDGTARVWDAATGQPLTPPFQHAGEVQYAEFSPDGGRVVTASSDGTARVWDAVRGEAITPPLKHEMDVWHAAFSPDGSRVVTASWDHTVRVWDATTGEPIGPPLRHGARVNCAAFGPDGHSIVSASADQTVRLWDMVGGQPLTRAHEHRDRRFFRHDWDMADGQPVTLGLNNEVRHRVLSPQSRYAAFSPDARRFVTASFDETARVWDATTGEELIAPLRHGGFVRRAAFSPDGNRIVTASADGTARIWDVRTGDPITPPLRHSKVVRHAVFSPDGRCVLTASWDGTARVWNAATGEPLTPPLKHSEGVEDAAFSFDGLRVVTACNDNTAQVWNALTGEHLVSLLQHTRPLESVAFSSDGRWILTASKDHTARVWDAATGRPLTLVKHNNEVRHAGFSPDGRRIVTASSDGTARVWDATTGEPITPLLIHKSDVRYAAFSPDGRRVVTASKDRTARVWDAATGEPLGLPLRCDAYVWRAEFSPDGQRILTSSEDSMARVWYLTWDNRPAADLSLLMQLLNGQQLDSTGAAVAMEPEAIRMVWQTLKAKYPGLFAIAPAKALLWHWEEAEKNETAQRWFAARFHLERLIGAEPDDQALRHRLELVRQQIGKEPGGIGRSGDKAEP